MQIQSEPPRPAQSSATDPADTAPPRTPAASLRRRFLVPVVAAVIVGTIMSWWLANRLYADALERRLIDQLGRAADVLSAGRFPLTPEVLGGLAALLGSDIQLLDGQRKVVNRISVADGAGPPQGTTGGTNQDRPVGPSARVERALDPGRDSRYRSVVLTAHLSDIRSAASRSAAWLAAGAASLILALSWIGHRIVSSVTRPVRSLAGMADAIAAGERGVRVPVERADEIGALAGSLNTMAERLEGYESELAQSNRLAALGIVSARIAHEIRNPLTAIKLQVQLLGESVGPRDRQTVLGLEREIDRLELMVSGVLYQARPTPGDLHPQAVDVTELTRGLADLFGPQLAHRGIELALDFATDLPLVRLDPERFKQVAVNLLVNARDALPEGGTIRLGWTPYGTTGWVRFTVDDSGPGMPVDDPSLPRGPVSSTKPDGLGIGFRLSREIVQAHGGRLELARSPLGGLQARVDLPISGPDEAST